MGRSGTGVKEASATSYELSFTYRGVFCRERIKLQPSPANLKRVTNHLGAIKSAIEAGTFDYAVTFPESNNRFKFIEKPGEGIRLEDYMEKWLERERAHRKSSTWETHKRTVMNIILPKFSGTLLSDLKRTSIKQWLAAMDCGNKRLSNIQSVLRSALQEAVEDELIDLNPLYGYNYQRKNPPKVMDDVDPFTGDEQATILGRAVGQVKNMIQFFFWTGIRTSELIALNWDDVDWIRGVVRISKAMTHYSHAPEEPKTKAGYRDVKLLGPALEALKAQKAFTLLKGEEIFQNPFDNLRWAGDQAIRRAWTRTLKLAKVRYRRPYQTRHTYASMMLTAGEPIAWLAEQMGHSDWGMLRRVYARFIKDSMPEAGSKAVAMFFPETKKA